MERVVAILFLCLALLAASISLCSGYDNTVTVSPIGGDFTTITAALASITDAGGNALDGDGDGTAEGSPSDDYGWSFAVHDRDELVVVLWQEPGTLYPYDVGGDVSSLAVLSALYDGPIHTHSYGYQPVILTKLPSIEDGDAQISAVTVNAGATVVNASNEVVTLTVGTLVLPAGCRSSGRPDDCIKGNCR